MRRDLMLPSSRFFARIDAFECECPACGQIIRGHLSEQGQNRAAEARRRRPSTTRVYNPLTQRVNCPRCRRIFQAGLLLYPVQPGSRSGDQPPDCKPTHRQNLELRRQAGGWYAEHLRRTGDEVNVAILADCLCPKNGWAPACPIHGDHREETAHEIA